MKRMGRARRALAAALLTACLLSGTGCDQHVASELANLSGGFFGDIVSVIVTRYLELALGLEGVDAEETAEHEHEHHSGPLHDYEH
jgi:hypothetical protein